jgi:hypothetical protein
MWSYRPNKDNHPREQTMASINAHWVRAVIDQIVKELETCLDHQLKAKQVLLSFLKVISNVKILKYKMAYSER